MQPAGRSASWLKPRARALPFLLLAVTGAAVAEPWALPGDLLLRNDLQLLSDAGLLNVPLTTWPVSLPDVARALRDDKAVNLDPAIRAAYLRVKRRLRDAARPGPGDRELSIAVASEPIRLRGFQDTPREAAELRSASSWMGKRFAWRLETTLVASPEDDRKLRFDGSYAGMVLGNWTLSIDAMPRWWGPGYDGSLILGTAARPVPAVTLERNNSLAFDFPVLRWLGPWDFTFFAGQLESNRHVPEAKLIGMRVTLKPTEKLEIGLARTAQWGGEGRPESFESFTDLMLGRDNIGDDIATVEEEPGNQLAGIDFRWRSPLIGNLPYGIYGQLIGEDEAGGMPSRHIGQVGLETWGGLDFLDAGYRVYLEYADTTMSFYDDEPRYNGTYEHSIYRDGYRYRGRSIGHGLDNDSQMLSLGVTLTRHTGDTWGLNLQRAELNRDGTGRHTLSNGARTELIRLHGSHSRDLFGGRMQLGLAVDRTETAAASADHEFHGFARWSIAW